MIEWCSYDIMTNYLCFGEGRRKITTPAYVGKQKVRTSITHGSESISTLHHIRSLALTGFHREHPQIRINISNIFWYVNVNPFQQYCTDTIPMEKKHTHTHTHTRTRTHKCTPTRTRALTHSLRYLCHLPHSGYLQGHKDTRSPVPIYTHVAA